MEINFQNIRVVYPKTVIFSIKENCYSRKSRESYALRSWVTKHGRVNIQKTLRLETKSKKKFMVGNINKAKMKTLAERDWLLIKILRGRRQEKKNPRFSLNWFSGLCIVTFLLLLGFFACTSGMLKKHLLFSKSWFRWDWLSRLIFVILVFK